VYPHRVDPQPNPESLSLTPDEAFDRPAMRYPAARRQKRKLTEPCLEVKESVTSGRDRQPPDRVPAGRMAAVAGRAD
jgi:hypothetical protein